MRIAIDARVLASPQPTGVAVWAKSILDQLWTLPVADKHQWVLWASGAAPAHHPPDWWNSLQERYPYPWIEWRWLPVPNKLLMASWWAGSTHYNWKQLCGSVDVVWLPNLAFVPPFHDRSFRLITTVHDLSFIRYRECFTIKQRLWHQCLRPEKLLKSSDLCIAVSQHTAADVAASYNMSVDQIQVIYPGLAPSDFLPITHQTTSQDPVTFLSLATLEPRKNVSTLLDAFALLHRSHPSWRLQLVGDSGWKSDKIRQQASQQPGVQWLGYVTPTTKQQLLAEASAFVYPSLYEGFGLPPLEAQAAGLPVIAGLHSSLPEVLGNGALYVDPLNPVMLASAMEQLVTDSALANQLRSSGNQNCRRFDWHKTASQLLDILVR